MTHYRSDIDGLHAIAVIAIVLFHLEVAGFGGGYVGVDVFFVISGFLITSIIQRELATRSFRFVRFYERRIRRLFPALFTVLLACCARWRPAGCRFIATTITSATAERPRRSRRWARRFARYPDSPDGA